jgi:hypothetical protein
MAPALIGLAATLLAGHATAGGLPAAAALLPPAGVDVVVARVVDDEARALATGRGLPVGRPLVVRVLDRPHLAAERDALGAWHRSPVEARAEASLRWRLGIGGDPRQPIGSRAGPIAGVEVTGLYDPIGQRVDVANWIPLETGRVGRWRDVALALLDRRFTLQSFLAARGPTPDKRRDEGDDADLQSDALLARQALVEGDATVQALERLSPEGPPPSQLFGALVEEARRTTTEEAEKAEPLELAQRQLVQLDGPAFVAAIRARAPWSAVNDVWGRPPASSEQILHADKYQRHEAPDDLSSRLPRELPGGWRTAFRDTLGEIGVRVFLQRAVGPYRAERAAAGWAGDRVGLYRDARADVDDESAAGPGPSSGGGDVERASHELVVWVSTWDDATDAADFADQCLEALGALAGAPLAVVTVPRPGRGSAARPLPRRWRHIDSAGRLSLLEQQGTFVGMMLGAPAEMERAWPALITKAPRPLPARSGPPRPARRR